MFRTIVFLVLGISAIFWLPWWMMVVFMIFGIVFSPYPSVFLIPAFFADMVYAPHTGNFFSHIIQNHKTVLLVVGLLIIWYLLRTKTRLHHIYDSKTF